MKISAYPLYQNYVYSVDKVTSNRGLTFRTKNVGTVQLERQLDIRLREHSIIDGRNEI